MSTQQNCKDFEWMVGPHLDGELPASDARAAEAHIAACAACQRAVAELQAIDRTARSAARLPAVSPQEWARVWDAVSRKPQGVIVRPQRRTVEWLIPALSLAALLALGLWLAQALVTGSKDTSPQMIQGGPKTPVPAATNPISGEAATERVKG